MADGEEIALENDGEKVSDVYGLLVGYDCTATGISFGFQAPSSVGLSDG